MDVIFTFVTTRLANGLVDKESLCISVGLLRFITNLEI